MFGDVKVGGSGTLRASFSKADRVKAGMGRDDSYVGFPWCCEQTAKQHDTCDNGRRRGYLAGETVAHNQTLGISGRSDTPHSLKGNGIVAICTTP